MKFAILSVGLLITGLARADEQKIEVKDLPKPVLAAIKAKFPEAKVTGAAKEEADGKTVYEVAIKDDDETADLAVSPKGKILEVEKSIAAKKLPSAITTALEAKYPKAKIKKAEVVVKYEEDEDDEEEKTFEVILAAPGKEDVEVKLSPKGKILDDGEEEDEDEKGKKDKKDDDKKGKKKKDKDDDKDEKKKDKKKD